MTIGTTSLSEKNGFSLACITGHCCCLASSLQGAQVANHRMAVGLPQRVERRHACPRFGVRDNLENLRVLELLNLRIAGNIGSALAAPSIQSVASSARGRKGLGTD